MLTTQSVQDRGPLGYRQKSVCFSTLQVSWLGAVVGPNASLDSRDGDGCEASLEGPLDKAGLVATAYLYLSFVGLCRATDDHPCSNLGPYLGYTKTRCSDSASYSVYPPPKKKNTKNEEIPETTKAHDHTLRTSYAPASMPSPCRAHIALRA